MTRRLLLSFSPGEVWAALVVADELIELRLLRTGAEPRTGDLFLGRVIRIRPELPAVLIDIGATRPGFLSGEDMLPGDHFEEGQAVIVQVTKEARADKAAGLTMKLGLNEARRRSILSMAEKATSPSLLEERNIAVVVALKEFIEFPLDEIIVDDAAAFAEARAWLVRNRPELTTVLSHHREMTSLFQTHGIRPSIDAALAPRLPLPDGGSLTIETLAAATFIDVDSGRGSALATNLAGAALIARHIILRNLAGPIVIDFIGMKSRQDRQKVVETLAEGLTDDPHLQLLGWTRLGHFELARKRKGVPLMELLFEHSALGFVKRPLTVALEALRALQRQSEQTPARRFGIRAHRQVAIALEFDALRARRELEARLGYSIAITDNREERHTYDIVPITTGNHHGT